MPSPGLPAELEGLQAAGHPKDPPPRNPLASTLEATAAILPYVASPREPRFTPQQRREWDTAGHALALAWDTRQESWQPLRRAVFKLLEGALALEHPAPLALAEALALATDPLEFSPPSPRRLTALAASVELVAEASFLEHEALPERVDQLVRRLQSDEDGPRSRVADTLFAQEAQEEIDTLRAAMEAVPPDVTALAEAARQIQRLAEPLELDALAQAASCFAETIARSSPAVLDHSPGRNETFAWISGLETWVKTIATGNMGNIDDMGAFSAFQTELSRRHQILRRLVKRKSRRAQNSI